MLSSAQIMMKRETIAIADIYVPIKRRATLEQKRVDEIALSILDDGAGTDPSKAGRCAFRTR